MQEQEMKRWQLAVQAMDCGDDAALGALMGSENVDEVKAVIRHLVAVFDRIAAEKGGSIHSGKKRKRRGGKSYTVTDEELLYHIADAGLLHLLHGVSTSKPKAFYFDRVPDIKDVVDRYTASATT